MSTPIETNTNELQEILQTVYNLSMSGGGSNEPDLVITGMVQGDDGKGNYFAFVSGIYTYGLYGPEYIEIDQEQVVSAYEKLVSGKEVKAVLYLPVYLFNSWDGAWAVRHPATRIAATRESDHVRLVVRFVCTAEYASGYGNSFCVEYTFNVDTERRTATLDFWTNWKLNTTNV